MGTNLGFGVDSFDVDLVGVAIEAFDMIDMGNRVEEAVKVSVKKIFDDAIDKNSLGVGLRAVGV